jgi:hypothetical protein
LSALAGFSDRLMTIGDTWRLFAFATARMVKKRDAMNPEILADQLRALADQEDVFFRDLKAAVA